MLSFLTWIFPSRENDHRASLIKPQILSTLTLVFVCSQVFLNLFSLSNFKVLGYSSDILPEKIIELTNDERKEAGLLALRENPELSEAARRKAADMFAYNYWAHISPSGRDPWAFFKEVGYQYSFAGENLARDFYDSESVITAWMNSPSHKDNLLSEKYDEIGVAVVGGTLLGTETTLVVQLFGKPGFSSQITNSGEVMARGNLNEESSFAPLGIQAGKSTQKGTFELINPFLLTKAIGFLLVGIIFVTFLLDLLFISNKKTPRLSSRTFAHLLFLGFIILMVIVSQPGLII